MTVTVRHPLTDEDLDVRSVISETVESARLAILRAFRELPTPTTQTAVANTADVSRQAVSPHLTAFQEQGLVNGHEDGIKVTAGGLLFLEVIENCLQTISIEALSYLSRSAHPFILLQALTKHPYRLSELQTISSDLPSQSTIRRILATFAEYEWVSDEGGLQRITSTGKDVCFAYGELCTAVEQLIEKAPWLQRLPLDAATFPVAALVDADLVVSNPRNPASVLETCLKLYDRNISQFRCLCSVYNPVLFQAYRGLLELGIESEAILDWPTAKEAAASRATRYAVKSGRYDNYRPLVMERPQTLGIGLYDDRKVAVAAYNEVGSGRHIAMIISSSDQLVDWGLELYESYRVKARPASEILLE